MQFKIGDSVVHVAHGVGRVISLDEKHITGQEVTLYYEVATQKGTVWVPVGTQPTLRLRPLTSGGELSRYRAVLKSRPAPLDPDHRKRHLALAERLKDGSFKTMCETVRDLTAHGWRKTLSEGDLTRLRKARLDLAEEWAAAANTSIEAAAQEIDALLQECQKAHKH